MARLTRGPKATNLVFLPLKPGGSGEVVVVAVCPTLGTTQPYSSLGRASGIGSYQTLCLPIQSRRQKRKDRNSSARSR